MNTSTQRQPTEPEIEAVMYAITFISKCINPADGKINGAHWRHIYDMLAHLTEYEIWLGLCNMEEALFEATEQITFVQATLFELFQIAHEQGIKAL